MKVISFLVLFNFCNTFVFAGVEDEAFLIGIKDYALKYPDDFFYFREKGADSENDKRVLIDKDPISKKPSLDIRVGGKIPVALEFSKLISTFSNLTNLGSDNPRRYYDVKSISINLTHNKKQRDVVCNINDFYKCGYSSIGYCQDTVKQMGESNHGYIVSPVESFFVYNKTLFLQCEEKRIEIDISRMPKKQQEFLKEHPEYRPKPGAGILK